MIDTVVRLLNATLDIINRYNKRKASKNPATTIANSDDDIVQSDVTYSELSEQSRSDKPE